MEGNGQRPDSARPVEVQPASDSADQMRVLHAEVEALRAEVARLRAERSLHAGNQRRARALERVAASASHGVRLWCSRGWYRLTGHVLAGRKRTARTDEPAAPALVHGRWEWSFGLLILFIAAFLRFSDLSILPSGLHGDEAITGLEGQRILREGWIGPYSPQALGQPSGPLYATAAAVGWLGHTVFAVRVVPALLGTLTVAALFVLLRLSAGSRVALIGAALLAVMNWHVHFSRIGFPLASWPLLVLLAAIALVEATKRGQTRWWAITGFLLGLGLYAYNAHPLILAVFVGYALHRCLGMASWTSLLALGLYALAPGPIPLLILVCTLGWLLVKGRTEPAELGRLAALGAGLIVVALPLLLYATDERNNYLAHARMTSVFNSDDWKVLTGEERVSFLVDRYLSFWERVCCDRVVDGVDGTGVTPLVPLPMLALAGIGAVSGVVRSRGPVVSLGLLTVALAPLAATVTDQGAARRTLEMAPFLAAFAALGTLTLIEGLSLQNWRRSIVAGALAVGLVVPTVAQNIDGYFGHFAGSTMNRWVFAQDIAVASAFMGRLPPGRPVYFYAERWSFGYETRQFLAPNVVGEDRSVEFGTPGLEIEPGAATPVFVFLGKYREQAAEAASRYPGGETIIGGPPDDPTFVAYLPPVPDAALNPSLHAALP